MIETVSQLENGIHLHQVAEMGLNAAGGGDFVHHAHILQRHLVPLDDGFTHLRNAGALLETGRVDLTHEVGATPDGTHHLGHGVGSARKHLAGANFLHTQNVDVYIFSPQA